MPNKITSSSDEPLPVPKGHYKFQRSWRDRKEEIERTERAIEALRKAAKLEKSDRVALANNLGRMYEQAKHDNSKRSLRDLFVRAFGTEAFDSQYKKRTRFLRLPDERPSEVLNAEGWKYVVLAGAIAGLRAQTVGSGAPEDYLPATNVKLLRGTSFEPGNNRTSPSEQRVRLLELSDALLTKVRREVDLDLMRERSRRNAIEVLRGFPERGAESLQIAEAPEQLPNHWANMLDVPKHGIGPWVSPLAPTVRLGTVHTPAAATRSGWLKVPATRLRALGPDDAVLVSLAEISGFPIPVEGRSNEASEDRITDTDNIDDLFDFLIENSEWPLDQPVDAPSDTDWRLYARLGVYLQLRYSPEADEWRVALSIGSATDFDGLFFDFDRRIAGLPDNWKTGTGGTPIDEINYAISPHGEPDGTFPVLIATNEHYGPDDFFDADGLADADLGDREPGPFKPVNGMIFGCTALPDEAAFEFLLRPLSGDQHFEPEIAQAALPVPAEQGSIAEMLLKNAGLDKSQEEDWLETLLIRDARIRADAVERVVRPLEDRFEAAFSARTRL